MLQWATSSYCAGTGDETRGFSPISQLSTWFWTLNLERFQCSVAVHQPPLKGNYYPDTIIIVG